MNLEEEHGSPSDANVDRVVDVAIDHFAAHGFVETKLDAISRDSGMSKRMIHYHFGDKQGLYKRALAAAALRIHPLGDELVIDTGVPVEGVRKLIDLLFERYADSPSAVRLLNRESFEHVLDPHPGRPLVDVSPLTLHLNKLLMLGQDCGAFRPGISANDIFVIIGALTMYPVSNQEMTRNLLGIDLSTHANSAGLHRLVVDTVLSFLTSNMPNSGHESYLVAPQAADSAEELDDIYGDS